MRTRPSNSLRSSIPRRRSTLVLPSPAFSLIKLANAAIDELIKAGDLHAVTINASPPDVGDA